MTLDEAIDHCEEVANGMTVQGKCPECAADHRQLAEWLKELKRLKEQEPTIDNIRGEIERQEKWLMVAGYTAYNVDMALDAIKSVVAESEEFNG